MAPPQRSLRRPANHTTHRRWFPAVAARIWRVTNGSRVKAATLLIVGGDDDAVITLNEETLVLLRRPKQKIVIPGAEKRRHLH